MEFLCYGVMMRSKAAHSATSSAFQSMWGLYLAGWMADQRLKGFQMASTMAGLTRWAIPTASTMEFLCSSDSCLVGWMVHQTPTVGPRAVMSASRIDLVPLRAG